MRGIRKTIRYVRVVRCYLKLCRLGEHPTHVMFDGLCACESWAQFKAERGEPTGMTLTLPVWTPLGEPDKWEEK